MIPAHELYQHHVHRQHGRVKTYNVVLKRLENRIMQTAKMDKYECDYEVPSFIVGEPMYEIQDCVLYLYMKLHRSGYRVKLLDGVTVRVSWRRYDERAVDPTVPVITGVPQVPQVHVPQVAHVPHVPQVAHVPQVPVSAYQSLAYRKKVSFSENETANTMSHQPKLLKTSYQNKKGLPSLEQLMQRRQNELF
jgi:hypothetical protein